MKFVPTPFALYLAVLLTSPLLASPDQPVIEPFEVTKSYAENGDPTAQFNLGIYYTKKDQGAKEFATGVEWYKRAAQAGFAPAQFNLGVLYSNGVGIARDDKEAIKWLSAAAAQDLFDAQKILIEFYLDGRGIPKNPVAALAWDFRARHTLELLHAQPSGEPPHPAVVRKDGAAELVINGTKRIFHPDGGEETPGPDGSRLLTYKDGKRKTIARDGTETTHSPDGFVLVNYPDGRKTIRDPKGTLETFYPDGRKDLEGTSTDKYGRELRITESRKDGAILGRVTVRGNLTVREKTGGATTVETIVTDPKGVKLRLTETVQPDGSVGKGRLARVDNGVGPKDVERWTIQREIEPGDGTSLLVEEVYTEFGLGEQTPLKKKSLKPPPPPPSAPSPGFAVVQGQTWAEGKIEQPKQAVQVRFGNAPAEDVLKPKVDIKPMLKELEDLELKGLHFAGATEADWVKAKAGAAAHLVIPLGNVPQKPGGSVSSFDLQKLTSGTFPRQNLLPTKDDFSKQFAFGLHGLEVIKLYPWKHAQTEHFIVHYLEDEDAALSMQYIEGAYRMIELLLGLEPKRGAQKGHVFLFANEADWKSYLLKSNKPDRLGGFAYKNELLLPAASEREGRETLVKTLCHEVTHAILARFYPGAKVPLWLNEGFAEYLAARTIATKRTHKVDKYMSTLVDRPMKVDEVFLRMKYGLAPAPAPGVISPVRFIGRNEPDPVLAFYANAAWCVRALCEKLPPEGLPKFFNALCAGNSPDACFRYAYGAKCPDTKAFSAIVNSMELPKAEKGKGKR